MSGFSVAVSSGTASGVVGNNDEGGVTPKRPANTAENLQLSLLKFQRFIIPPKNYRKLVSQLKVHSVSQILRVLKVHRFPSTSPVRPPPLLPRGVAEFRRVPGPPPTCFPRNCASGDEMHLRQRSRVVGWWWRSSDDHRMASYNTANSRRFPRARCKLRPHPGGTARCELPR